MDSYLHGPISAKCGRPSPRLAEADDGRWSLIELVEIRAAEPGAFEEVRDAVEKNYRVRKGSEALRELLTRLRHQTTITIDDDGLSDVANWQTLDASPCGPPTRPCRRTHQFNQNANWIRIQSRIGPT